MVYEKNDFPMVYDIIATDTFFVGSNTILTGHLNPLETMGTKANTDVVVVGACIDDRLKNMGIVVSTSFIIGTSKEDSLQPPDYYYLD